MESPADQPHPVPRDKDCKGKIWDQSLGGRSGCQEAKRPSSPNQLSQGHVGPTLLAGLESHVDTRLSDVWVSLSLRAALSFPDSVKNLNF